MERKLNETLVAIEEQYIAPEIEVIEVEILQNILGGSTELPEIPGKEW